MTDRTLTNEQFNYLLGELTRIIDNPKETPNRRAKALATRSDMLRGSGSAHSTVGSKPDHRPLEVNRNRGETAANYEYDGTII